MVGLDDFIPEIALMPSCNGGLPEIMVKEPSAYLNMAWHCPKWVVEIIGRDVVDVCEVHAPCIVTVSGCTYIVRVYCDRGVT